MRHVAGLKGASYSSIFCKSILCLRISIANFQTCAEEIPRGRVTSYSHIARLLGRCKQNLVLATVFNVRRRAPDMLF